MQLVSISVGLPREIDHHGKPVLTGIFKSPLAAGTEAAAGYLGLVGDGQADLENHGGVDKALYAYTVENYAFWENELGRAALPHGQFGENFTVSGMADDSVCLGDVYRIGGLLVQVTQPRVPCYKLGLRFGMPDFPKRFMASGRVGFYLRVLQPGTVCAGDTIELIQADPERLNIADCMLALRDGPRQQEIIRRALSVAALSDAWREDLSQRLVA